MNVVVFSVKPEKQDDRKSRMENGANFPGGKRRLHKNRNIGK